MSQGPDGGRARGERLVVVVRVKAEFGLPTAAYHVSGEAARLLTSR